MWIANCRFPARITISGTNENGWPRDAFATGLASIAILQIAAIAIASAIDGTLFLPGVGVGFLEHYGVWLILITDPLLIIATANSCSSFAGAMSDLPIASKPGSKEKADEIIAPQFDFVAMRGRAFHIYALLVVVGLLAWLNNLRQTEEPLTIYGNDVFDSAQYHWGYYANKVNLFVSWVLVYPLAGFQLVSMAVSTRIILERLTNRDLLQPNVFHPDGCYGLKRLGQLNVALILPYGLAYGVVFALISTHQNSYFSVYAALVGLTTALILASFFTLGPVTRLGKITKKNLFEKLKAKSSDYNGNEKRVTNRFAFERILYATARASPYSAWAMTAIQTLRLVPLALTAYRLFV